MENSKEENPIKNQNKVNTLKSKFNIKYTDPLIFITIITLLLSLYGKLLSIGWLTIILCMFPIIPLHFILFTMGGLLLSQIKKRTFLDYILFFILCITLLLYAFTFVDSGDTGSNKAINWVDDATLSRISVVSFFVNAFLSFTSIIRFLLYYKKTEKI